MLELMAGDWRPLVLTLKVASLSTLVATVVGVALACLLAQKRSWWGELADSLVTLPLVLPPTVMGYYLLVLLGRRGWLGAFLHETLGVSLMFTWQGAVLAAAVVSVPLVFRSARAALESVRPEYAGVARTLGQGELAVFLRVSLPLAWRGIVAGSLLAFARGMGEFGATLMVAGNIPGETQTLSLAIYEAVESGQGGRAVALVLLTSVVCSVILIGSGRLLKVRHGV